MKKLFYLFFVLILASCGSEKTANIFSDAPKTEAGILKITAQSIVSQIDMGKYKEGEVLVKFKSGMVTTSSLKTHQSVGASAMELPYRSSASILTKLAMRPGTTPGPK